VILLQTPTIFWLGGGTIFLSYRVYMGLMMLGRQKHTAEPIVPEPSVSEFELATEKLKRQKCPCIDQIPEEMIKAGVEQFALRSINLLILFAIRRNCLRSGRSRSLFLPLRRAIKQIIVIIETFLFCQLRTKLYQVSCCQD